MPTVSLTVLPAKALKGGKNKVRIAVAHNCQTRYIVTDIIIDSLKEWRNGQIVKRDDAAYLNTRLRQKLNEVQQALDAVPYPEGLSCPELIETITATRKKESPTLRSAFEEMMSFADVKPTTVREYKHTFNSLVKYIPENTRMKALTPLMVRNYLKKRADISQSTKQMHIALLSRIINYCQQNKYTDYPVSPTAKVLKFKTIVRQNWLTPDQVRFIRDYPNEKKWCRKFRDVLGVDTLTLYSARKSFTQHAFQLGISESVIDYILGHSLNAGRRSTIYSYIKVTPAMATVAIKKVIDFINGNNNFD